MCAKQRHILWNKAMESENSMALFFEICAKFQESPYPHTEFIRTTPETFKGLGLSQQTAFCPSKVILAGINYLYFCNNIFAEKHIVESSESAIIFFNVSTDCSTKTFECKQNEAALIFTLSSS